MRRRWLATFGIVEKEYRPPTAEERSDFKSLGFTDKDIDECVKYTYSWMIDPLKGVRFA